MVALSVARSGNLSKRKNDNDDYHISLSLGTGSESRDCTVPGRVWTFVNSR